MSRKESAPGGGNSRCTGLAAGPDLARVLGEETGGPCGWRPVKGHAIK